MATCPTYANPSRTRRTLCLVAIEQTPGCTITQLMGNKTPTLTANGSNEDFSQTGLEQTTLYENFNPLAAEFDTVQMNRARTGLGPEGFAIGIGTFRFTGSVYVVGSGKANVAPVWAKVLQACGWRQTRYASNSKPVVTGVTGTASNNGAGAMNSAAGTPTYKYRLTKYDASDKKESKPSAAISVVFTGTDDACTIDWSGEATIAAGFATGDKLRIYRTVADGSAYFFVAEISDYTTNTSFIDVIGDSQLGESDITQIGTPSVTDVTGTPSNGAGALDVGATYKYKFSILDTITGRESGLSALLQVVTGGSDDTVELDWSAQPELHNALNCKGIRIYRTAGGGSDYKYLAEVLYTDVGYDGTYTDLIADGSRGATAPAWGPTDEILWEPLNEQHKSLSFKNMLDGISYVAAGVRGNISFAADSGQPVRGDIDLQGTYSDGTIEANIGALSNPGVPPRLLEISAYMYDSDGVTYSKSTGKKLIVKNVGVNLGTQVSRRTDAQEESGLIEYGLFGEFQPRLTMQVEVLNDTNHTVDFLKKFRQGIKYYVEFTVSTAGIDDSTVGTHITFFTAYTDSGVGEPGKNTIVPTAGTYNTQLATPPTFGDVENVRTWNLEFVPGGAATENVVADNFLMMRHW